MFDVKTATMTTYILVRIFARTEILVVTPEDNHNMWLYIMGFHDTLKIKGLIND
jgi:hypothetical protein